jgi:hypothetical protein
VADDALVGDPVDHFTKARLQRLHGLENRSRGLFAESVVACALPGAELAPAPYSEWDILWRGIQIAVRTTGRFNYRALAEARRAKCGWEFKPVSRLVERGEKRRVWAHVVVLCLHESKQILDGWSFFVVPRWWVEDHPTGRITPQSPGLPAAATAHRLADEVSSTWAENLSILEGASIER